MNDSFEPTPDLTSTPMSKSLHKTAIVWFRNDLRLHDNISLRRAIENAETVIPVYVFDKRYLTAHGYSRVGNFPRAGVKRLRFALECVEDLKNSLISIGSNLLVVVGHTENEIEKIVNQTGATLIVGHKEVTYAETNVEKRLIRKYANTNVVLDFLWDNTMYHIDDLPFDISNIPDVYTTFRKQVEAKSQVRAPLPTPTTLSAFPIKDISPLPTLIDLGITEEEINSEIPNKSELQFKGGEKAALQRMQDYFFTFNCLKEYKETRNGLLGANYSSKFSCWLAYGCLSPRTIYANVKQYERQVVENQSTYWMLFELLWRDYFKFWVYKVGNVIFHLEGPKNRKDLKWKHDADLFRAWTSGTTGFPFVDACMRELNATGFMSNRGRQNVCSFLARDMGLDWRLGAEYFENKLLDYDVCSNWGNWVYGTGVGNDPREDRYFNIIKQASVYDPKGEFVKFWCPELANVPTDLVHTPWKMSALEQKKYKCELGTNYPKPVVKLVAGMNAWTGSKKQFK